MLGEEYTLEYLPLFDEELASAVRYIAQTSEPILSYADGRMWYNLRHEIL